MCCWSKVPDVTRSLWNFVTTWRRRKKCADSFLLLLILCVLFFIFFKKFLFKPFSMRFFQVLKRRKSWVHCYFPATRSGRVWREIGTDWFTANTPSKPNIATLAASIWLPILDRLWSSGWTLSVWPPFYKIPRVYPSREFDVVIVSLLFLYTIHHLTFKFFSLPFSFLTDPSWIKVNWTCPVDPPLSTEVVVPPKPSSSQRTRRQELMRRSTRQHPISRQVRVSHFLDSIVACALIYNHPNYLTLKNIL